MTESVESRPTAGERLVPALTWIRGYRRSWMSNDLVAGLTTAAVVVPQSMAYATIAGLPVEIGLYTAVVPMVLYAVLGTSRVLSVSTTSTISILVAAQLADAAAADGTADLVSVANTLALLVGLMLVAAFILRLGFLANLVSRPVLAGFKAGLGLVIIVSQLGKILGVSVPKGSFFQMLGDLIRSLPDVDGLSVAVAAIGLVILLGLPRVMPSIPAPLVAVGVTIVISALADLQGSGVAIVGDIPGGLPPIADIDLSLFGQLWPAAMGIALMAFTESVAAGQSFTSPNDPPIDANQELLALGVGNVLGGVTSAYAAGGGASQTAVNSNAGARTPVAALVTAGTVCLTLVALAPLVAFIPQPMLGALVLVAALGLLDLGELRSIFSVRVGEFTWAIVALVGVIVLGTLEGIVVAVIVSGIHIIVLANKPPVYRVARVPGTEAFRRLGDHPGDETFPGLLLLRTEGRMHFASIPAVTERIWPLIDAAEAKVVCLDMRAVPDIEYTALVTLSEFDGKLAQRGMELWITSLNPDPLESIERAKELGWIPRIELFYNLQSAVMAYQDRRRPWTGVSDSGDHPDPGT